MIHQGSFQQTGFHVLPSLNKEGIKNLVYLGAYIELVVQRAAAPPPTIEMILIRGSQRDVVYLG